MSGPKVSVIMNCLNCARDLPAALESVRAQTMRDLEIIFWDNGSTDESASIAKSFGAPLRYFNGGKTVPLGAARNLAIREARGSYLAFLDCDDVWLPEKLACQLSLFESNPRLGLVCTDTEIFNGEKTLSLLFDKGEPARGMVFDELMARQWVSMSSAMVSRAGMNAVEEKPGCWFDEKLNVCEEADLFYRVAHDFELDYVPQPLTRWRVHGQNTTLRKFGQFATETLYILDKYRRLYPGFDSVHAGVAALMEKRAAFQKAVDLWRRGEGRLARAALAPYRAESRKHRLFWWASYLPGSLFDAAGRVYFALPASWRK